MLLAGTAWLWIGIVLATAALAGAAVPYLAYRRSPAKGWRDRVLGLAAAARRQLAAERAVLHYLAGQRQAEERVLRQRAFVHCLHGVGVDHLDEYPGIGPATIARLAEAGYSSLATLQDLRIGALGLGKKRLADVGRAVRELTRQTQRRFDAGDCGEAQALAEALAELRARYAEREAVARERIHQAEALLKQLEGMIAVAAAVTFRRFLGRDRHHLVPPDLLTAALPPLPAAHAPAPLPAVAPLNHHPVATPAAAVPRAAEDPFGLAPAPATWVMPATASPPANRPPLARPSPSPSPLVAEGAGARKATVTVPSPQAPTPAQPAPPPDPLATLEIPPSVPLSADLVRRHYHLLWERLSPAKLEALGPDFVELAERKRAAVRAAALALLAPLGEPLEAAPPAAPRGLRDNPDLDAAFGA